MKKCYRNLLGDDKDLERLSESDSKVFSEPKKSY